MGSLRDKYSQKSGKKWHGDQWAKKGGNPRQNNSFRMYRKVANLPVSEERGGGPRRKGSRPDVGLTFSAKRPSHERRKVGSELSDRPGGQARSQGKKERTFRKCGKKKKGEGRCETVIQSLHEPEPEKRRVHSH